MELSEVKPKEGRHQPPSPRRSPILAVAFDMMCKFTEPPRRTYCVEACVLSFFFSFCPSVCPSVRLSFSLSLSLILCCKINSLSYNYRQVSTGKSKRDTGRHSTIAVKCNKIEPLENRILKRQERRAPPAENSV